MPPSRQSITLIWGWREKSVSQHLNKLSIISNSIIVTCGWWMWWCDVVIADRRRINPGQLWMLYTTGTVKANKPFHTPLLPWKLTTLRASMSFRSFVLYLSVTKWKLMFKYLIISLVYLVCPLVSLYIFNNSYYLLLGICK